MTDERPEDNPEQPAEPTGSAAAGAGDEKSSWTNFDSADDGGTSDAGADTAGSKMLTQLQAMIDSIATQAAPAAKQIGAKAAELTAAAADRAGPFAHKAGDVAADASGKLAQRSRELAADLRRELASSGNGTSPTDAAADAGSSVSDAADDAASTATAVIDRPDDLIGDETKPPGNEPG